MGEFGIFSIQPENYLVLRKFGFRLNIQKPGTHPCSPDVSFDDMTVNCTAEIIEITAPYCAFYNEGIVSTAFRGEGDNCIIKNSGVNMEMSVPVRVSEN